MQSRTHICLRASSLAAFVGLLLPGGCADPGQTEIARGNVLAARNQFEAALDAYRAAARTAPHKARPRELMGHLLFDLGRAPEARAAYEEAVEVEPKGALEARIGLARLDAEDRNFEGALARLRQVLEEQPNNLYALLSRANVAIRRGGPQDAELAIADTAKAMLVDPKSAAVLYTRGTSFIAGGRLEEAAETFRLLQKAHPDLPLAWYGQARLAAIHRDREATLSNLREARGKAEKGSTAWDPRQILSDPDFRFLRDDPQFAAIVNSPQPRRTQ
jgi:tetratricopeptide (TPR) repeat protein